MSSLGADIQIENGNFTRIHNAILEKMAEGKFTAYEHKCLWFLFRMTYGWGKKQDAITLNQWAEGTHIDKRNVKRVLDGLIKRKVILCVKGPGGRGHVATYGFNKYHEAWQTVCVDTPKETVCVDTPISKETVCVDTPETVCVDTPTKERKKAAATGVVRDPYVLAYERYIGVVESPIAGERIADWAGRLSIGAWEYCLKEAHDNNGRNWKYMTAILQRVEREGAPVQDVPKNGKPKEVAYITDPRTGERKQVLI